MSLISGKVMEEFATWAEENGDKNIFPVISKEEGSYYIKRDSEETYMMEYTFKTMAELKRALEEYSGLSDEPNMLRMMTVEIMQDRFMGQLNLKSTGIQNGVQEKDNELPEFAYVF